MTRITLLEMLMKAGLINGLQFDMALQNRVMYGGKIGTSLIELGFVKEEELARFLSRKLAVPYVPPRYLLNISPQVIALLPRELAVKYSAVPLGVQKRRLDLAMADPSDLKAIDDISFATGYIIRPVVAPEVRLVQALGKYYEAPVDDRYRELIGRIDAQPAAETGEEPPAPPAETEDLPERQPEAAETGGAGAEPLEEADLVEEGLAERVGRYAIDELSRALARAEDREDIAAALLGYCGSRFSRCALFLISGEAAYGWKGVKEGGELPAFGYFSLPLDSASVLRSVTAEGAPFVGALPETIGNRLMLDALGGGAPRSVLLVPLVVMEKVVSVLYLDDPARDLK
ncbi:MAG TPA: hypothetical protein VNX25_05280, partial [Verrucomicrobiae bacterium]|nr:hypothetical protein [Verrucomicrobiae bacterium]